MARLHRQAEVVKMHREKIRTGKNTALDVLVMKWYVQQRLVGINVRGIKILAASRKLAQKRETGNCRGRDCVCGYIAINTDFLMRLCRVKQVMQTQSASNFSI